MTTRAVPAQNPCDSSASPRREKNGMPSLFTRSPSRLSTAGNSVTVTASATSTTMIAPAPRAFMMFDGTSNSPASAITTMNPENTTARLAVSPALAIASILSTPRRRSSRNRSMMNSE